MKLKNKQSGITLVGALMVMSIIGFLAYTGIKIGPVYSENWSVKKAMKSVAAEPGVGNKSPAAIKEMMSRHFYSSYVERVTLKDIKITRSRGKKMVIKYQVQEAFLGNIDLLIKFNESIDLN